MTVDWERRAMNAPWKRTVIVNERRIRPLARRKLQRKTASGARTSLQLAVA
jgi:hypothetical protein